jgi:ABC-type sugar transport system ATPase subunit
MIYVTHDQKEAMSLGTKITVMEEGKVIQTGSPLHLYSEPDNKFVASFLGDINILSGKVVSSGKELVVETEEGLFKVLKKRDYPTGEEVEVAFRPENVLFQEGVNNISCVISDIEYYGETFKIKCLTDTGKMLELKIFAGSIKLEVGLKIKFSISPENLILFSK